ncbi:hypothetical protein BN193_05900 [Lactococcus raffinolactis 4877]|nr:hypothetical protein BN193_05900 [Lactococcus raffinolactis 4877]
MVKYSGLERHKKYHFRIVYQKAYENGKKMMFDVRNRYSFAKTIPNWSNSEAIEKVYFFENF